MKIVLALIIGLLVCDTGFAAVRPSGKTDRYSALKMRSSTLTAEQLLELEQKVARQPDDVDGHIMLIYHYIYISGAARHASAREHLLWIMEHAPKTKFLDQYGGSQLNDGSGAYNKRGGEIWQQHLRKQPKDLVILKHAALFFSYMNEKLAISLLEKGYALDQANPDWSERLADLSYRMLKPGMTAEQRRPLVLMSLKHTEIVYNSRKESSDTYAADLPLSLARLANLPWQLARLALEAGELDKAELYAEKMFNPSNSQVLDEMNKYYTHLLLGQVALKRNQVDVAKKHLFIAGNTGSLGFRNLSLAKMLLEKGEKQAVLEFLEMSKSVSQDNQWQNQIEEWKSAIAANEKPDFDDKYLTMPDDLLNFGFSC